MDRERRVTDDDLARSHRATDPVGPNDQPEGAEMQEHNPSSSNMDRPLVGRSGQTDDKSTEGEG